MIPKIIHQTLPTKDEINPAFIENANKLKRLNPGWSYRLYDDHDIHTFIDHHYNHLLPVYESIDTMYGPARADFFRYLLMQHTGGVYLDIKSTVDVPLDNVLKQDDEYILSYWNQHRNPGAGFFPELEPYQEFQQWHIVCRPQHPFLEEVIGSVVRNIEDYQPYKGVGKMGVLRLCGPIAYTKAIVNIKAQHKHRFLDIVDLGFRYTMFQNCMIHNSSYRRQHYSSLEHSIVRGR